MPDPAEKVVFPCPHCGKRYRQPADRAGMKANCKACGEPFRLVPADAPAAKRSAKPNPRPKPARKPAPAAAPADHWGDVNFDDGEPVDEFADPAGRIDDDFARPAPRRRGGSPSRSRGRRRSASGGGTPARSFWRAMLWAGGVWLGTAVLAGLLTFLFAPSLALWSMAALVALWLTMMGGGLWLIVEAFKEEAIHGLACLFLPFYQLYYAVTRWDRVWRPVSMQLLAIPLFLLSMLALGGGMAAAGWGPDAGGSANPGRFDSAPFGDDFGGPDFGGPSGFDRPDFGRPDFPQPNFDRPNDFPDPPTFEPPTFDPPDVSPPAGEPARPIGGSAPGGFGSPNGFGRPGGFGGPGAFDSPGGRGRFVIAFTLPVEDVRDPARTSLLRRAALSKGGHVTSQDPGTGRMELWVFGTEEDANGLLQKIRDDGFAVSDASVTKG